MKYKNIFFGLCASTVIASEISAMQLVTKRVSKSVHHVNRIEPMLQKRKYVAETLVSIIPAIPLIYYASQAITVFGFAAVGCVLDGVENTYKYVRSPKAFRTEKLYYQIANIGSDECSIAYSTNLTRFKVPCGNPMCCKYLDDDIKRKEIFDDIDHKIDVLSVIKSSMQKLSEKEKEGQLLWEEGKITAEQCKEIAGLLEHKKDCHAKQLALFEQFMKE